MSSSTSWWLHALLSFPQDIGLEPRATHFMQVPANNVLRLAAWGSAATLALWDLDEFLVLPNHRPIQQEMSAGCLQGVYGARAIVCMCVLHLSVYVCVCVHTACAWCMACTHDLVVLLWGGTMLELFLQSKTQQIDRMQVCKLECGDRWSCYRASRPVSGKHH